MKRPDALELIAWTLMGCLFWIIIILVVAIVIVVITITAETPDLPYNLPCAGLSGAEWYRIIAGM
jgi:hypothetical protein